MDNIQVEINQAEVERQKNALAALSVNNPDTRKYIRKLIRQEISKARSRVMSDIRGELANDPRSAYRAVRYSVWRSVLGGNVNILAARKAGNRYELITPKKIDSNPKQWGGNRRKRSDRTRDLQTYYGKDRSFILRFLSNGVNNERHIKFTSDPKRASVKRGSHGGLHYGNTINTGARGYIAPRNFFAPSANRNLQIAAENLGYMIDEILNIEFEKEENR